MLVLSAVISKLNLGEVCSQAHSYGCRLVSDLHQLLAGDISTLPDRPLHNSAHMSIDFLQSKQVRELERGPSQKLQYVCYLISEVLSPNFTLLGVSRHAQSTFKRRGLPKDVNTKKQVSLGPIFESTYHGTNH